MVRHGGNRGLVGLALGGKIAGIGAVEAADPHRRQHPGRGEEFPLAELGQHQQQDRQGSAGLGEMTEVAPGNALLIEDRPGFQVVDLADGGFHGLAVVGLKGAIGHAEALPEQMQMALGAGLGGVAPPDCGTSKMPSAPAVRGNSQ